MKVKNRISDDFSTMALSLGQCIKVKILLQQLSFFYFLNRHEKE